jgi:hypothetical protein
MTAKPALKKTLEGLLHTKEEERQSHTQELRREIL